MAFFDKKNVPKDVIIEMVLPPRIELEFQHYHCCVLPLNYGSGSDNYYIECRIKLQE
jgi:hypothetical protein